MVRQWPNKLRYHFWINQNILDTVLFADDQTIIAKTEDDSPAGIIYTYILNIIYKDLSFKISAVKQKSWHWKEVHTLGQNSCWNKVIK